MPSVLYIAKPLRTQPAAICSGLQSSFSKNDILRTTSLLQDLDLGGLYALFFRKRLCVIRLVALRRFDRPDAIALQLPGYGAPVYPKDGFNGRPADPCSNQRFNLVPLFPAAMSEF